MKQLKYFSALVTWSALHAPMGTSVSLFIAHNTRNDPVWTFNRNQLPFSSMEAFSGKRKNLTCKSTATKPGEKFEKTQQNHKIGFYRMYEKMRNVEGFFIFLLYWIIFVQSVFLRMWEGSSRKCLLMNVFGWDTYPSSMGQYPPSYYSCTCLHCVWRIFLSSKICCCFNTMSLNVSPYKCLKKKKVSWNSNKSKQTEKTLHIFIFLSNFSNLY